MRSPNKTKIRATFKVKVDDFERNVIRRKVHDFWFRKEIPTLNKILMAVNENPDLHFQKVHFTFANGGLEFRAC